MDHSGQDRLVPNEILTAFLSETISYFSEVRILLTVLVVSDFVAVRVLVFAALVLDGRWRISDIFSFFAVIFDFFFVKEFLRSEVNQIRKLVKSNPEQTNRQIN